MCVDLSPQLHSCSIPAVMEALEKDTSQERKSYNVLNRNEIGTASKMPICKHSAFTQISNMNKILIESARKQFESYFKTLGNHSLWCAVLSPL